MWKAGLFAVPVAASYEREWAEFRAAQGIDGRPHSDIPAAFRAHVDLVKNFNAQGGFQLSHTGPYAAMTNSEFQNYTKGLKRGIVALGGVRQTYEASGEDIPDRVDWREENVVTAVKDQGGCGSCWAFSAAETYESHLALATGSLELLSAQQIVSCSPNPEHCGGTGGCQGSTQPLAFEYLAGVGLTTEASYPYTQRTGTCEESKIQPVGYSSGWVDLPLNDYTALIDAVATQGPIAISIAASGFKFQLYGSGVLTGCNDYVMDHAVQLVGYGQDSDEDYYLVRNSWGKSWGEGGYVRFRRYGEGSEPCGTDNKPQDGDACQGDTTPRTYCGECGILSASSYPTGMSLTPVDPVPHPTPAPTPPLPTPAPTPAPTPGPGPGPEPSPYGCDFAFDKESCELTPDTASGERCEWCYLSGLGYGFCVTPAEGTEGCNGAAAARAVAV